VVIDPFSQVLAFPFQGESISRRAYCHRSQVCWIAWEGGKTGTKGEHAKVKLAHVAHNIFIVCKKIKARKKTEFDMRY
jgi:hypothetical protein